MIMDDIFHYTAGNSLPTGDIMAASNEWSNFSWLPLVYHCEANYRYVVSCCQ
jgi:hypothetical protein